MNPGFKLLEDSEVYRFQLSGINVSLANSIRRVILSEIPCIVFHTETYEDNKCTIEINTSRLHNEIIKQRLSCIPIHETDLEVLTDKYILEVDVKNETDNIIYVTTEDFRVKNKANGNYLTKEVVRKLFPPNIKTNRYIDFVRLKPKITATIPGEHLKLSCEFSVSQAKANNMYNVVSKCAYSNTPDLEKIDKVWSEMEKKLQSEQLSIEEIEFQKKNFYLLDAQRIFVDDSFDFIVESIGVYENKALPKKACAILQNKFVDMITAIDGDIIPIHMSETTMDYCYDIVLENEDYTMGKVIEYILYERFYQGEKTLSFCGFKKMHPHNADSIIRIAFVDTADKTMVRDYLRKACVDAQAFYKKAYELL
jgi:DNA-directed RNA polymerase II subunit RPB3